jgi:ABC-2 type transport system permease protein
MRGSLLVLLIASFAFVCTAVAIGTLIATFARNQQQSMLGGFLFLFPAILLSGLMFPLENMPTS